MIHAKHIDTVTDIMTKDPVAIHLKTSISEVAEIFDEGKFHHLPVLDGKELIGIVSYLDLIRVSFERSFGVSDTKAVYEVLDSTLDIESIMTKDPLCIQCTSSVREAAEKLATGSLHSLPVVNDEHELMGIITSKDLIEYLLKKFY